MSDEFYGPTAGHYVRLGIRAMWATRRRRLAVLLAACVLLGMTGTVVAGSTLHGPVDARTLMLSVIEATDSTQEILEPGRTCRPRGALTWSCTVLDDEGSSQGTYRVVLRSGSSCWDARLLGPSNPGLPRAASRCVHRWE
jgi:hypothetical protein